MKQGPNITPVILADIILTLVRGKSKSNFKKLLDKDTYSNKEISANTKYKFHYNMYLRNVFKYSSEYFSFRFFNLEGILESIFLQ